MSLNSLRPRPRDTATDRPAPAPAVRVVRPGWRDPRIVAGLLVIGLSVLVGARVFAAADDTIAVWSVRRAVATGSVLAPEDLTRRRVRLDRAASEAYVGTEEPSPAGRALLRPVSAGELLPRAALRTGTAPAEVEVPLSVARESVPGQVQAGSLVDVWVVPAAGEREQVADLALARVRVVEAPRGGDALAPQATRAVVVAVDSGRDLAPVLAAMADGRIVLTVRTSA